MAFTSSGTEMLFQLNNITPENFNVTNTQGKSIKQLFDDLASDHGYREVFSDTGKSLGYASAASIGMISATAASTAAAGESVLGSAYLELTGAGTAASGELTTLFAGLSSMPLATVVGGLAVGCGAVGGIAIGQKIVEDNFEEIDKIVKDFTINNRIAVWVKNNKAYVNTEMAQKLAQLMLEKGYFTANGMIDAYTDPIVEPVEVSVVDVNRMVDFMAEQVFESYNLPQFRLLSQWMKGNVAAYDLGGVSSITMSKVYEHDTYVIRIISTAVATITGTITDNNQTFAVNFGSEETEQKVTYIELANGTDYSFSQTSYTDDEMRSDTATHYIQLINVGTLNENGLDTQDGAVLPESGNISEDYPTWASNQLFVGHHVEDETVVPYPALPLSLDAITTQIMEQVGTIADTIADAIADAIADTATEEDVEPVEPHPPIGTIPDIVAPTNGCGNGFVNVYSPTKAQLATFSQWLWTTDIFDNISKLIHNDPMQAILGVNLLYATPSLAEGNSNIIVGNLNSGCASRVVDEQYISIDCGSVDVKAYYGNVLDYTNLRLSVYLPFVGIVPIEARDFIGRTMKIKCRVDVITGTVLYKIMVLHDNGSKKHPIYTFEGNCAVQIPLTAASYSGIFSTIASIAGSAITGLATKGPVGALVGGLGSAGANLAGGGFQQQIQRSGSIGANAGAMGYKKPYLIMEREVPYNARAFNKFYGYPSNQTVTLSKCTGYTRIVRTRLHDIYREVDGSKVMATNDEIAMIDRQLKEGVIL